MIAELAVNTHDSEFAVRIHEGELAANLHDSERAANTHDSELATTIHCDSTACKCNVFFHPAILNFCDLPASNWETCVHTYL